MMNLKLSPYHVRSSAARIQASEFQLNELWKSGNDSVKFNSFGCAYCLEQLEVL